MSDEVDEASAASRGYGLRITQETAIAASSAQPRQLREPDGNRIVRSVTIEYWVSGQPYVGLRSLGADNSGRGDGSLDSHNAKDQEHRMSDETTPQDGKAMSPASAGSQPVAWSVMVRGQYRDIWDTREQAKERADGITYWDGDDLVTASVQPLYREPALTDEEREAIKAGIEACEDITYGGPCDADAATVLRRMLERLG